MICNVFLPAHTKAPSAVNQSTKQQHHQLTYSIFNLFTPKHALFAMVFACFVGNTLLIARFKTFILFEWSQHGLVLTCHVGASHGIQKFTSTSPPPLQTICEVCTRALKKARTGNNKWKLCSLQSEKRKKTPVFSTFYCLVVKHVHHEKLLCTLFYYRFGGAHVQGQTRGNNRLQSC